MKRRSGFKKIVVDGIEYQYIISFPVDKPALVVVYSSDTTKMEIPLKSATIIDRQDVPPTWRGKRGDKGFGRYEVACIIKQYIKKSMSYKSD